MVSVPDVVGTTSSQATATLRNAGFDVNLVSVPSDRAPGTVVAQAPPAGSEQPEGSTIRLNVAEAATGTTTGTTTAPDDDRARDDRRPPPQPQPATVPDVVGQELAEGARAFADEGLKVERRLRALAGGPRAVSSRRRSRPGPSSSAATPSS